MKFLPSPGFDEDLLRSDGIRELLETFRGPLIAGADSRVRKRSEALADSIEYEVGDVDGILTGRLRATDFKAHWHEAGTSKKRAQPYLRPTVEEVVGPVTGGGR